MKPITRLVLLLIIATATFSSCKKAGPKQTKFIPKEAVLVLSLNTGSLQDKLIKSQATLENLFKYLKDGSDTSMQKAKAEWEDFKNSGVDLDDNMYISMVSKGGGNMMPNSGTQVHAAISGLKDGGKMEAYLKKKEPSTTIQKEKDYSYAFVKENMVAWGKDVVIFMSYQKAGRPQMEFDTTTNTYIPKPQGGNSEAELKTEMASYFNLKSDATIASIDEFQDLAKEKADLSFWVNSASASDNMPMNLPKVKELTEGSFTAGTVNFEDGKIVANTKSYVSKALGDLLKKYSGPEVNLNLIEKYPSNNINAFVLMAFNPEFFNALVRYVEVGGMVDGYLTKIMGTNYSLQDALKALKGDMAIVVSDVSAAKSEVSPMGRGMMTRPSMKVLFNATVGDKVQLNKMLDKLVEQQMLVKANNEYALNPALRSMGMQLSVTDKNILLATDSAVLQQYKAQTGKAEFASNVLNDFKGKPVAMFVDLEKIMNAFPSTDTAANKVATSARETFKNMKGYSDKFNGNFAEGHFELNFKNEKENSLTSLLKFASVAGQNLERKDMQMMSRDGEDVQIDTVVVAP